VYLPYIVIVSTSYKGDLKLKPVQQPWHGQTDSPLDYGLDCFKINIDLHIKIRHQYQINMRLWTYSLVASINSVGGGNKEMKLL